MTGRGSTADVALHAGVSQQTVSRVPGGGAHSGRAVRERVPRAGERPGLLPNGNVRALATRRSRRVGLPTGSASRHRPAAPPDGPERAARRPGTAGGARWPR